MAEKMGDKKEKEKLTSTFVLCLIMCVFAGSFQENDSYMSTILSKFIYLKNYKYLKMYVLYVLMQISKPWLNFKNTYFISQSL